MKNMTTNQKIVVVVILSILVLSLGIRKVMHDNQQAKADKTTKDQQMVIDSLSNALDSSMAVNKSLEDEITAVHYSMEQLNATIEQDKQTISNLKKRRNEKTAAVSNYSSDDIIKFLTDRYKQDSTSTK